MRVTRGGPLLNCVSAGGGSLAELRLSLSRRAGALKARLSPELPFGVGLRLTSGVAAELDRPAALRELKAFLDKRGLFVFTIGDAAGGRKETAFRPDWLEPERRAHTDRLARILSALLPEGVSGTIGTLPGAFRPRVGGAEQARRVAANLRRHAELLERLERDVALALEPEPFCQLESAGDVAAFFDLHLGEPWLRRRIGVCLDACHSAVSFERPVEAARTLERAGVALLKVQLGAGLTLRWSEGVPRGGEDAPLDSALERLARDARLHQVFERREGRIRGFLDLPEALSHARREGEWRVHWHAPLHAPRFGAFGTTADETEALLRWLKAPYPQLELETDGDPVKDARWAISRLN